MDNLDIEIRESIRNVIDSAYPNASTTSISIDIGRPPNRSLGDFSFPCFQLAKTLRESPKSIAETLAKQFRPPPIVSRCQAVGGYLNGFVERRILAQRTCQEILNQGADFGTNRDLADEVIMVEFSSPNTNKPQHLGHVRNNILGDALARVLQSSGAKVIRTSLVNDRGIHICKTLVAYNRWGAGATPASLSKKGDHFVGDLYVEFEDNFKREFESWAEINNVNLGQLSAGERDKRKEEFFREHSELGNEAQELLRKWESGDKEVLDQWSTMKRWVMDGFEKTYTDLGVHFDRYYFESDTDELGKAIVSDGLERGIFVRRDDGSIVVDLSEEKLSQKVLLRSDGTSVYITQDLGTAVTRQRELGLTRCVYVVAREQEHHFRLLFRILKLLGHQWANGLFHRSYGMVHLTSGRMKSREGTVVDADDLLSQLLELATEEIQKRAGMTADDLDIRARQVSLGALKFYLLAVDPLHDITYKPEESIAFEGKTGPYVQYAHARICSILRKAGLSSIDLKPPAGIETSDDLEISDDELDVLMDLRSFPEMVSQAAASYDPSKIAFALYDLSKNFSQFYSRHQVLRASNPIQRGLRLALCAASAQVIRNGLEMLGIEAPQEM